MASVIATRRLRKELTNLQKDPPPDIIAEPKECDILTWYFALRGPADTPYYGGVYIGKLKFPPEYPMKAPSILMLTPSGRFKVNTRICMSMSDFHNELWQPSWSVATILQGVVSFMTSEEITTGGLEAPEAERKRFAKLSIDYNTKNFPDLFQSDIDAAFAEADKAREAAANLQAENAKKATMQAARKNTKETQQEKTKQVKQEEKSNELTPEEAEKRRIRNAKKRAKQKAKKKATANASP